MCICTIESYRATVNYRRLTPDVFLFLCTFVLYLPTQHNDRKVEVEKISRRSFDRLIPCYVVEQSNRSCLCVTCYKAKLVMIALYDFWATLHQGPTPDVACACECDLCKDGGCKDYLPYESRKDVYSMGKFSDAHMCPKEFLYISQDGTRVEAHKSTCVSGNCVECKRKQAVFFGCPQHRGGAERHLYPSPREGTPAGELRWNMFTDVDEQGRATTRATSASRRQGHTEEDDDFEPGGGSRSKQRQVLNHDLRFLCFSRPNGTQGASCFQRAASARHCCDHLFFPALFTARRLSQKNEER